MRVFLAAALLLCACAHGKDDRTICPEYRGQRCLGAQTCAIDKQRGCEVCACKGTNIGPDGKPTVNSN